MRFLKRLLGLGGTDEKHENESSFDCPKCGEEFETEAELKIHKHKHKGGDDTAASETADVDYDELVTHTIKEIKSEVKDKDVDYKKLLKAEKKNKDRKTLKSWIEDQME